MYITYKCQSGETLEAIAKKQKIKKPDEIWQIGKNKALKKAYDKKKSFDKGTALTLLDPKAEVYVLQTRSGKVVLDKAAYKKLTTQMNKHMDAVLKGCEEGLRTTMLEHRAQGDVNRDYPIVALLSGAASEPKMQAGLARGGVNALRAVVRARDYKNFETTAKAAVKLVDAYRKAMAKWIDDLSGNAGNWAKGFSLVRDGSFVVFGVVAGVVAAPATAVGVVVVGTGSSAAAGFMSASGNELGRALAGDPVTLSGSAKAVAEQTIKSAGWGLVFSTVGAGVGKLVGDKLAAAFANNSKITKVGEKLVGSRFGPLFKRLAQKDLKNLVKTNPKFTAKEVEAIYAKVAPGVMSKFVTGLGVAKVKKSVQAEVGAQVEDFLKKNATKLKGKLSEDKIADLIAQQMTDGVLFEKAVQKVIEDNMKALVPKLQEEVQNEAKKTAAAGASS